MPIPHNGTSFRKLGGGVKRGFRGGANEICLTLRSVLPSVDGSGLARFLRRDRSGLRNHPSPILVICPDRTVPADELRQGTNPRKVARPVECLCGRPLQAVAAIKKQFFTFEAWPKIGNVAAAQDDRALFYRWKTAFILDLHN